MNKLNKEKLKHNKPKTPRQLWIAAVLSLVLSGVVIYFGFLALPSLADEHQAFWSGLIGSFVGSAVAFGGAAWLWRLERHILIDERVDDRAELRREEQRRGDQRSLRDCLAVVGNLQALNYHMADEGNYATARDKFLMRIRFSEAATMIQAESLRSELEFMSRLMQDSHAALDFMVLPEHSRLRVVHQWLLRLVALNDDQKPEDARPENYEKLASKLDDYDEYREEQSALIAEYEEEQQVKAKAQEQHEAEQES
ncbi:hypothetical protein ACX80I_02450 [Arthrobacter sp. MDT3-44]